MHMRARRVDTLIEEYAGLTGTTYRVRWRTAGRRDGAPDVETCPDLGTARRFRDLMLLCGRTRPTRDQLLAHGLHTLVPDADPPAPTLTVADLCAAYLDWKAARHDKPISASSLGTYRDHLRLRIAATALGVMPAAQVTGGHVQAWQAAACVRYSPRTVAAARGGVLAPAFRWGTAARSSGTSGRPLLPGANPVPDVDTPATARFRRAFLHTPAEYALMLAHARAISPRWADLLTVEAVTGLRWCEAIDAYADALDVRRRVLHVVRHAVGATSVPGTKAGPTEFREVPLPDAVVSMLSGRGGLLLPAVYGRRWTSDDHMWTKLRKRLAGDGIAAHLTHHSLRHGIATWWGSCGIDPAKRDALLGHKPRTMGAHYSDTLTEIDLAAARDASARLLATN
jgi:integrase